MRVNYNLLSSLIIEESCKLVKEEKTIYFVNSGNERFFLSTLSIY